MHKLFLAGFLLLAPVAQAETVSCVPVDVEAPQALPHADGWRGAGCLDYRRVPAGAAGPTAQVLVFGDPQVKSESDVDYFRRDIVQPIHGRYTASLGLTLGDLVDDVPALLPAVKTVTETLVTTYAISEMIAAMFRPRLIGLSASVSSERAFTR